MEKSIITYTNGDTILAKYIPECKWNEGLQFHSNDDEFVQVGTWKYNAGKQLLAHVHNKVDRVVSRTHEVLYVKKGIVLAYIFNLNGKLVTTIELATGDTLILLECGHGYTILQDDTQVLEVQNSIYLGADIDRTRI